MKQILLLAAVLLVGCTSGYRSYKKGDYVKATFDAVERLRNAPTNDKAAFVLSKTYPLAVESLQRELVRAKASTSPTNYELVVQHYETLNTLANEIFHSPAALKIIPKPLEFIAEAAQAKEKAAYQCYELGLKLLNNTTVHDARLAYVLFKRANSYVYDFRDVQKLIDEARFQGTLRVFFEKPVTSNRFQYSADFFSSNLLAELNRSLEKHLIAFYSAELNETNSNLRPHQYLVLNFEDFSIGNVFDTQRVMDVKRDSVLVGTATVNGQKVNVYNTVTAKLSTFRREIKSGGVLSVKIFNDKNQLIDQQNFSGEYVWYSSWSTFNGDERALSAEQKRQCELRPQLPPPHQNLFVEFTKPIYSQTLNYLRNYYKKR